MAMMMDNEGGEREGVMPMASGKAKGHSSGLSLGCEPNGRRNQEEEEERTEEGRGCVSRAWHVPS